MIVAQTPSASFSQPVRLTLWSPPVPVSDPTRPTPRAQLCLNAPGVELETPLVIAVLFGYKVYLKSLKVEIGTSASMRGSIDAAAN